MGAFDTEFQIEHSNRHVEISVRKYVSLRRSQ
jgi:hypothetical protein